MYVNLMNFLVRIQVEEENVFRNFGCVMVIGKKRFLRRIFADFDRLILVIVMMEVMKDHVPAVWRKILFC
jgi:hypothetical protein